MKECCLPTPLWVKFISTPQFWSKWTVSSKNLGTPFSKLETEILRESRPKHHIVGYNFKFELSLRIDLNYELWGQLAKPHTPPLRAFFEPSLNMLNNCYKIDHKSDDVYSIQFLCTELSSIHSDESDECLQTYILASFIHNHHSFIYLYGFLFCRFYTPQPTPNY